MENVAHVAIVFRDGKSLIRGRQFIEAIRPVFLFSFRAAIELLRHSLDLDIPLI